MRRRLRGESNPEGIARFTIDGVRFPCAYDLEGDFFAQTRTVRCSGLECRGERPCCEQCFGTCLDRDGPECAIRAFVVGKGATKGSVEQAGTRVTLEMRQSELSVLHGTVVDQAGRPRAEQIVRFDVELAAVATVLRYRVRTDAAGKFEIKGLPLGAAIRHIPPDRTQAKVESNLPRDPDRQGDTAWVGRVTGEGYYWARITHDMDPTISILIQDEHGTPMRGVPVYMKVERVRVDDPNQARPESYYTIRDTTTDEGKLTFSTREYPLDGAGATRKFWLWICESQQYFGASGELNAAQTEYTVRVLPLPGTVKGKVVDTNGQSVSKVRVVLEYIFGPQDLETLTAEDGSFEFRNMGYPTGWPEKLFCQVQLPDSMVCLVNGILKITADDIAPGSFVTFTIMRE